VLMTRAHLWPMTDNRAVSYRVGRHAAHLLPKPAASPTGSRFPGNSGVAGGASGIRSSPSLRGLVAAPDRSTSKGRNRRGWAWLRALRRDCRMACLQRRRGRASDSDDQPPREPLIRVALPRVDTDLSRSARQQVPGLHEKVLARTPAHRWGTPDDFAGIAIFLGSAASNFITGVAIPVDGGYSIQG
jgi:Enoyl-(Acyl carrier protein) reductase